jgi:hypothetical protein
MNGATAQADILGIFGSQGLDLATRWATPATNTPTYLAMKMYRNYDGNDSTFGDMSVQATVANPDDLDAFAAVRGSDGALTVMVINKNITNAESVTLSISNLVITGAAQVWQLAGGHLGQLANAGVTNGILSQVLPSQSVTLFVVPSVAAFQIQAGASHSPGQLQLWLYGQQDQSYVLQSSSNLKTWQDVSTNVLSSNSISFQIPMTNSTSTFYRAAFMGGE